MTISRRTILLAPIAGSLARAQVTTPTPDKAAAASVEEATPLFKTSISLVKVDAKVTTRDGRDIGDLHQDDFLIYDENEPQQISYFGRESEPVNVLLVLDVSASMRKSLSAMSAKAGEALSQLRPGDRVGVLLFASRNQVVLPLTDDHRAVTATITNSIFKETLGRGTLVNEALIEAARYLRGAGMPGRRAIVVVTDNEIVRESVADDAVLRELHGADTVLNAILLGVTDEAPAKASPYRNPANTPPDIARFAVGTGGDVISGGDPSAALRRIVQQATTRYSLQYAAPAATPGSFRHIRVELAPSILRRYPDSVVQSRDGYEAT